MAVAPERRPAPPLNMNSGQPRKPVPPKCSDCGNPQPMAVVRPGMEPDLMGGLTSHEWICGDCLYLREHPEAQRGIKPPRERSKRLQKETLFDL